jgi:hypothetical protein
VWNYFVYRYWVFGAPASKAQPDHDTTSGDL